MPNPWEKYQSTPQAEPQGPWSAYGGEQQAEIVDPTVEPDDSRTAMQYAGSAASGVNELLPAILGLPVDTGINLANLGIAGYGVARKEIGEALGEEGYQPPELLPPNIGGSQWWKKDLEQTAGTAGLESPFGYPETENPTQQNLRMAGGIMGSGVLAPAAGLKQVAANVAKMEIPAMGAIAGKELFPDQPLAPMLGMVAAPGAKAGIINVAQKMKTPVNQMFVKAHKLGYKIPPALAKQSKTQQLVEGSAGPVPVKQAASIHNQKVTNELIKKDLNYPKDAPLSSEGLAAVRAEFGKVYAKAKKLGTFTVDKAYNNEVMNIGRQGGALSAEFPALVKKDIADLAKSFAGKKTVSAEATIEAVKQLRADSTAGFKSQDPSIVAMAKAKGKLANTLEGLMERNIASTDSAAFLAEFRSARQGIAKTYTVEKALRGENVDAVALGRQLDKGKPLSGTIKDVAQFGQNFKGAAQVNVPQQTNFRPMDLVTGVAGATATGNPWWLAAMGARPALRSAILSSPYQAALARTKPAVIQKIMQMPKQAQAGAIASLLEDIKNQESQGNALQSE